MKGSGWSLETLTSYHLRGDCVRPYVSGLIVLDIFSREPLALAEVGARQKVLPLIPLPCRPLCPSVARLPQAWPLPLSYEGCCPHQGTV